MAMSVPLGGVLDADAAVAMVSVAVGLFGWSVAGVVSGGGWPAAGVVLVACEPVGEGCCDALDG